MMTTVTLPAQRPPSSDLLQALDSVQERVLWLATSSIHHANRVRPNPSRVKVGGHQASSASMVSLMTALYFAHLEAEDRVSVKPHAAPVLHAIEYLLGRLDARQLEGLREFGGLQSYPSRSKDPYPVDFSTGSVGIGATMPIWSALAHRYVADHFDVPPAGRQIALVGDAELDEGACWEAIVDPMVPRLGELLWVIDINRQSLDRVVPGMATDRIKGMFEAAGWHCITVKYGSLLGELFARPGGDALRTRIDRMSNEEYQWLLRSGHREVRDRLPGDGAEAEGIRQVISDIDDGELRAAIRDLGGHDLQALLDAYREADAVRDRPSVIFAYTVKGWRLPIEGHPGNHSALLGEDQWKGLARTLGADASDPWQRFEPGSAQDRLCREAAERLRRTAPALRPPPEIPRELTREHTGNTSTQQAFGRFFNDLDREAPEVAGHVVTVSPDVASSTNLGGWINRAGIWNVRNRQDWFADDPETLVHWKEGRRGRHVELGIAEVNLTGLLSELGLTWARDGQPLFPVGTLYDPFVGRALEPWSFGLYAGGQSILVGTPSGVTLAPEGGAHQSVTTPSIGLEQPGVTAWEPAFARDLEWILLHAMSRIGRKGGESAYLRLSTRPVDQELARIPPDASEREERRRAVLAGGYRLRESSVPPRLTIVGVGAVLPQAIAAAGELEAGGIPVDLVCLTSPDLVFRAMQGRRGLGSHDPAVLDRLFPVDRASPIVSVLDGHPHTLAFLGSIRGDAVTSLGVSGFGQSGTPDDLYRHFGIDQETIVGAALDLLHP
jgi:pyruvate dehydrogenase E1 component